MKKDDKENQKETEKADQIGHTADDEKSSHGSRKSTDIHILRSGDSERRAEHGIHYLSDNT